MSAESPYVTRVSGLSNYDLASFALHGLSRDNPQLNEASGFVRSLMVPGAIESSIVEYPRDRSLHLEAQAQVREIYRRIIAAGLEQYGAEVLPAGVESVSING